MSFHHFDEPSLMYDVIAGIDVVDRIALCYDRLNERVSGHSIDFERM
jgi:hypothetical protein